MQNLKPNNPPLVSICIPTYNGSQFLEETINSALNQTYSNIEIIVTDDHSSDNTIEICERFVQKDSRVKLYKNLKNLGLVGNWCEALKQASSNWVKFLFQDDILEPNCVERMIFAALDNNVNFVICNRAYFFEEGVDDHSKRFYNNIPDISKVFDQDRAYAPEETSKILAPYIFRNCIGEPPTFLINKDYFSRNDFPDNYFQLIDYIFILNKILKYNFVYISEKLVKFRVHNTSESKRNSSLDTENTKSLHKFLYIKYYEGIQLCYELIDNPLFSNVKKYIPTKDIIQIKNWITIDSYRKYGFNRVYLFYKQSTLSDFILDKFSSRYSYLKYRVFKIIYKKNRKKYGL